MPHATLLSNSDTDRITRGQLQTIPTPESTPTFRPIPHFELIDMLDRTLNQFGMHIESEQFAVRRDGFVLFGVFQLAYRETEDGIAALGLRTANNKTMSLQICAGLQVLVCSNMCFRGDMIALKRKHTRGLNLKEELTVALIRFQDHFGRLTGEIANLKERQLPDMEAKALIHDVFTQGLMPVRLLPEVSRQYFEPTMEEFSPRNAWSLHNAFTAAAKAMPMTTRLPAIQKVGKLFGMTENQARPAIAEPGATSDVA